MSIFGKLKSSDGELIQYVMKSSDEWRVINMEESLRREEVTMDEEDVDEEDEEDEEDAEVEIFSLFEKLCIRYLKDLANERLDEIEESCNETMSILMRRLRGKMRCHGIIRSVQGTISTSIWDTFEQKLITVSKSIESESPSIINYKISRHQLFKLFNPVYLSRYFDDAGKEMIYARNIIQKCDLFGSDQSGGYRMQMKRLAQKIANKYNDRKMEKMLGFNGLRVIYNERTKLIKLKTNTFRTSFTMVSNESVVFGNEIGRKSGW